MATIAVLGALDAHGIYHQFLSDCIRQNGHRAILIDVGTSGVPQVPPHISRENVSELKDLDWRVFKKNQASAHKMMLEAAPRRLRQLKDRNRIQGALFLGGGESLAVGRAALGGLPLGFPKLLVTTAPSPAKERASLLDDCVHLPCMVELEGLNKLSRPLLARAAGAICGMVEARESPAPQDAPVLFASVFGNTTTGVEHASRILRGHGYEILRFHATGSGGRTMEALLETGVAAGVLDYTLTELADEVVGGVLSAGPGRLDAAAKLGIPAVVVPGCLDLVKFHEKSSIPECYADRLLHVHRQRSTLMRTNPEEAVLIGKKVCEKLNTSTGPVSVLLPLRGTSAISARGFAFHDPKADAALFSTFRRFLRKDIPLKELDASVNDAEFAEACARELLEHVTRREASLSPFF